MKFKKITGQRGDQVLIFGQPIMLNNYTPASDIATLSVCVVILALLLFSFVRKTESYRIFLAVIPCLMFACMVDVGYHLFLTRQGLTLLTYILRCAYHASLFVVFFLFTMYIIVVTRLEGKVRKRILLVASLLLAVFVGADIYACFFGGVLRETEDGIISHGLTLFVTGYTLYALLDVFLLIFVRKRLYKRVISGFASTIVLSFLVLIRQILSGQTSFTTLSFLFPVIAMFYVLHSNPYDAELGAVDLDALNNTVRYYYNKKKPFVFMSLYLPTYDVEGKCMSAELQAVVRRFASDYFRGALLFKVSNGHLVLLFQKRRNPDFEHRIGKALTAFHDQHRIYQLDYKIVLGESMDEISRKNEYVSLILNTHRTMPENTIHRISPDDLSTFDRSEYILRQLEDIYKKRDLNDSRVLVFCQPVYNLKTGKYDTAEALMRLTLPETGLVFPDQFIYLAEEHGYIHSLTEIILNKTCREISRLLHEGYLITRISVNVSMLELKDDHFCDDIRTIVSRSGIPGDKVAIELTESQTESDFNLVKAKIAELKDQGIKFYLDDFGTGYSNMERIMALPFDIIKFDRSLVQASGVSERSERIVCNLANLFNDLHYSVLYEGVETDSDENLCRDMSASYLQGYKYSKPIPIADLRRFFERQEMAG